MDVPLFCMLVEFGTPEFDELFQLREKILRKPLNMTFSIDQIETEYDSYHLGCYAANTMQLLGCLILKPLDANRIKMRQVAVDDTFQKRGVGQYMVNYAEVLARKLGYSKIELHARYNVLGFYENLDYVQEGAIFQEVGINHIYMSKDLSISR